MQPDETAAKATPLVAILGRPNVGKSTLFNRLAGRRLAIVHDEPGVTRDRKTAPAELGGRPVTLMDTAGLEEAPPETIASRMRASTERAADLADLVLFVVDARSGLTPLDRHWADRLRRLGKPVLLLANKAEGRQGEASALEAWELGLGQPIAVSAEHGTGMDDLHDAIAEALPPLPEPEEGADDDAAEPEAGTERPLRMAIVGRPNAGKSSLLNRLVGEERMITGPEPGLTRDAVGTEWRDREGRLVRLVDTAGLRRKARIEGASLEELSVAETITALRQAEAVVLVLDAMLGLEAQDLQIARLVEREGRALVIALNKWDLVDEREAGRRRVMDRILTSLAQLKGIAVITLSAETGEGVQKLMPAVWETVRRWNARVSTGELNRWFEMMLDRHPPPLVDGRRLKLRYVTQAKTRPPTFAVFGTRAEQTPEDWRRYLVNGLRESFDLPGVPIRVSFRGSGENPFDRE